MIINVYSPSAGCVQCRGLMNWLRKHNIEFNHHLGDADDDLMEAIHERTQHLEGNSWPFVQVFTDDYKLKAEWQGFRPDKLEGLIA